MFEIKTTAKYKTQRKKLDQKSKDLLDNIIERLANNGILEPKYKDHNLTGNLKAYRECHIKPDLLLIYQKQDEILVLTCISVGSHSELFKK